MAFVANKALLPNMPNYGYHLARAEGRVISALYALFLPITVRRRINPSREVPLDVFSYSGKRRLAEQVASIRSFLTFAGRPNRFVVVSDGSHSEADIRLLRQVDESVTVEAVPAPPSGSAGGFARYLQYHPTGKQLALVMSLPRERAALYIDSDVLFFSGASELGKDAADKDTPAYYLEDCCFAGDERFLRGEEKTQSPVNTGVLLIRQPLDWSIGIQRFAELNGEPNFFTNQTLTHVTMHANGAQPLDPTKYVLRLDDQFVYADQFTDSHLVLRHYVDPVRHKFWTKLIR